MWLFFNWRADIRVFNVLVSIIFSINLSLCLFSLVCQYWYFDLFIFIGEQNVSMDDLKIICASYSCEENKLIGCSLLLVVVLGIGMSAVNTVCVFILVYHLRQGILRLEKVWVASRWMYRVFSTLFAMTVVDAYLGFCLEKRKVANDEDDGLLSFVDMPAHDLIRLDKTPLTNKEDPTMLHALAKLASTRGSRQFRCVECHKRASFHCTKCSTRRKKIGCCVECLQAHQSHK